VDLVVVSCAREAYLSGNCVNIMLGQPLTLGQKHAHKTYFCPYIGLITDFLPTGIKVDPLFGIDLSVS
jgi:hypothetical protein